MFKHYIIVEGKRYWLGHIHTDPYEYETLYVGEGWATVFRNPIERKELKRWINPSLVQTFGILEVEAS